MERHKQSTKKCESIVFKKTCAHMIEHVQKATPRKSLAIFLLYSTPPIVVEKYEEDQRKMKVIGMEHFVRGVFGHVIL